MKKISLCCTALFISVLLCAEKHQLGDYVEKDGVPSIVVYVDQTGEHGLLMSMSPSIVYATKKGVPDMTKKNDKKRKNMVSMFKKRYKFYHATRVKDKGPEALAHVNEMYDVQMEMIEKYLNFQPIIYTYAGQNLSLKKTNTFYENIKSSMAGSGKDNTKMIIDYCEENNYAPEDYCPIFYWATQLGQDWFIPGNDELELIAHSYGCDTFGLVSMVPIATGKNSNELYNNFDEVNSKIAYILRNVSMGLDYYWFNIWMGDIFWPICSLSSSTMVESNWSTKANIKKTMKMVNFNNWYAFEELSVAKQIDNQRFYSLQRRVGQIQKYYTGFFTNISGNICAVAWF